MQIHTVEVLSRDHLYFWMEVNYGERKVTWGRNARKTKEVVLNIENCHTVTTCDLLQTKEHPRR